MGGSAGQLRETKYSSIYILYTTIKSLRITNKSILHIIYTLT